MMFPTLRAGQRYLETYPNQKKLALFMPDYRLIRLVKFASRFMPAFACFAVMWQWFFVDPDQSILMSSVLTALFALSIPFQGLYWLGWRAKSPLPSGLLKWYAALCDKLKTANVAITEQTAPNFQDFAHLLHLAEKTWGQAYFDEL